MSAISAMPRSASVTAVEDSSLGMLSGAGFRAFMQEEPGAGYWMAVQLAARVRNLTEKARDLATLPVSARLQSELLRLALERPVDGDRCVIAPLPTHMELAARIGTHREAVTRELRLLHQEGIVGQQGRTLEIGKHTSELQSLLRNSYAVFCLNKKTHTHKNNNHKHTDKQP